MTDRLSGELRHEFVPTSLLVVLGSLVAVFVWTPDLPGGVLLATLALLGIATALSRIPLLGLYLCWGVWFFATAVYAFRLDDLLLAAIGVAAGSSFLWQSWRFYNDDR